jgi:hypothetical protein
MTDMRVRNLILSLVITMFFGAVQASAQCDCMGKTTQDIRGTIYETAYEELKNSDVVFYGQIVEMKMIPREPIRKDAQAYEIEMRFRVEKAWGRDLDEYTAIREYSDGCMIGFRIAERWLVYAKFDEQKNLRTGYCSRTRVADKNVEDDFKEFRKRGEPQTKIVTQSDNRGSKVEAP